MALGGDFGRREAWGEGGSPGERGFPREGVRGISIALSKFCNERRESAEAAECADSADFVPFVLDNFKGEGGNLVISEQVLWQVVHASEAHKSIEECSKD